MKEMTACKVLYWEVKHFLWFNSITLRTGLTLEKAIRDSEDGSHWRGVIYNVVNPWSEDTTKDMTHCSLINE